MTEHTENTDTHALLEKSQVVHQTSRGPTVDEVAARLLRRALEELYPERNIDPDQTLIGTPQWQSVDGTLVAMPTRFESLTQALVRQFFSSATANYLEGEHFLTLNPPTSPVVHLDLGIEAIARLLNDYAPLLFVAFGEHQLAYWNEAGQRAPHWLQLSDALRKTLEVQHLKDWDDEQCLVARAISLHPDKKQRQAHDSALSTIRVCLIDIDSVDAQGNIRHLILAGACVITGRYKQRDLLMMYTVENGYETFDSLEQLGASLPERVETQPTGRNLKWQLFEPEGNFFDHMAWALITTQLDAIAAISHESLTAETQQKFDSIALAEHASAQEKTALIGLDNSIPDWLFGASAADLDQYSQSVNALGKLYKQTDKKLVRILPLTTYAQNRLRDAIIADKKPAAGLPLDSLEITVTNSFESGGLTLPNPLDVHTETLGEYALQNSAPYQATLRFKPTQRLPDWLNVAYLTKMASKVDVGEAYPQLIKDKLIDDPLQAPLQQHFYIDQMRALLPLIALESKIRGIGGIDQLGCLYVREWLKPTLGHSQPVVTRPLTFIQSGQTTGDTVANMFIIAPREPAVGPCLLYRPLFEQPLLQFPSAQNLLYALHQPGELRDSVLAWLPDSDIAFKYAQYTFPVGLPSPWLAAQLLSEPWTTVDWTGPVELGSVELSGDIFKVLFKTHALAMAELSDRQSLSNAQRRWALLRDSGWALFNVAANFLSGPAGAAVWIWQSISEIEQVLDAHQRGDAYAQWSAVADMLLNLGMILAHHAATRRKTDPRTASAPQVDHDRLPETNVTPTVKPAAPTVTLVPTPITGELASSHYSSLEASGSVPHRSPSALVVFLSALSVPPPDLTAPTVETLLRDTARLYRLDAKTYAKVGERWYRVIENDDEQIQIVDPQTPSKTGPLLSHTQQGQWFVDTRLRLRAGAGGTSLRSQLKAQRKAKEQQKKQLGVELENFKRLEASNNAILIKAQAEMMDATGQAHEQATARYLSHLEKLIGDYDQALKNLEQWRINGGSEGYFQDLQHMTIELQKNLALWLVLKRNAYATLTHMLAQDTAIDSDASLQLHVESVRQALALSQEIIARLHISQVALEKIAAVSSAGMTTAQSLRKLMPVFTAWDLKSNEVGMSHELCMRNTATQNAEPAREAVGLVIIEAATATHRHTALIRTPDSGATSAQRIDTLSRLIDIYVDADQRLKDFPEEYPDKVEPTGLERVSTLIGEFRQLAQEQLNALLPVSGTSAVPAAPAPAVAGPSRPAGKVTKSRPRDPVPARPSPSGEPLLEEMVPTSKSPAPMSELDDIDIIANALTLTEEVQGFIDRTRKDAFRPNRIPADMQDLFDIQAQRLEQAAINVDLALARINKAGRTRLPVANLSSDLNEYAARLRTQGISIRASLLKERPPRQAYLQWLLDNNQVRVVRNQQGRIRTKKRQDYFQEYQVLDITDNDQPLWLVHFHYNSPDAPLAQYTAAHLKIADEKLKQFTAERRKVLTTLAPIDYVLRRISDPSLFFSLQDQP
ncbi:hypothetical protein [Pseudomonas sp. IT-P176]|uniref:hypothetical protein n=1 Tax=Pseudomonas sp. IT-P176 TaxID=3026444 RepID=UPI0039DF7D76